MSRTRASHSHSQDGSALVVSLLTLLILLPLALLLSASILRWQRQATDYRDRTETEFLVQAGVADAELRLGQRRIDPAPGETSSHRSELEGSTVEVSVYRQDDVVLGLDGRVLEGEEAKQADLDAVGLDPTFRRVRQYQRLEVYLLEGRAKPRPSLPEIRVRKVLVRTARARRAHPAPLKQIAVKVDRVFYEPPRREPGRTLGK